MVGGLDRDHVALASRFLDAEKTRENGRQDAGSRRTAAQGWAAAGFLNRIERHRPGIVRALVTLTRNASGRRCTSRTETPSLLNNILARARCAFEARHERRRIVSHHRPRAAGLERRGRLDVNVVGLFPNKAVLQIDGGAPKRSWGEEHRGRRPRVLDRDGATFDIATFDIQRKRMALGLGHASMRTGASAGSVMVTTDERGHLVTTGQVNGVPIRFTVDTGATFVTFPASEARRLGLDYLKGQKMLMNTATGSALAYRVKLDAVRAGGVTVNGVDAVVMEGDGISVALLGMSFLNRMDVTKREGEIMTLTKR
jgi:aspartyl protease family protein